MIRVRISGCLAELPTREDGGLGAWVFHVTHDLMKYFSFWDVMGDLLQEESLTNTGTWKFVPPHGHDGLGAERMRKWILEEETEEKFATIEPKTYEFTRLKHTTDIVGVEVRKAKTAPPKTPLSYFKSVNRGDLFQGNVKDESLEAAKETVRRYGYVGMCM